MFIGLPCPPGAALGLAVIVAALPARDWRCVAPVQRHLTLCFLGEQPEALVAGLTLALRAATAALGAFRLDLAGLGAFPAVARPETVWTGCAGPGVAALRQLAARVEAATAPLGLPAEARAFRPHLTLARRRREGDRRAATALIQGLCATWAGHRWGTVEVTEIVVFRSDLGPPGVRYTPVSRVPLASPPVQ
ncbi:MAG TPA: RNA 2',3'-cyclic phosphodiesterase [Bacillota bacterium]|nr:RNA 2',3'-cyclic phosphodiesterase [Bacillota bacterium]